MVQLCLITYYSFQIDEGASGRSLNKLNVEEDNLSLFRKHKAEYYKTNIEFKIKLKKQKKQLPVHYLFLHMNLLTVFSPGRVLNDQTSQDHNLHGCEGVHHCL